MEMMDIFNDDAFSLISMTAAINNIDHVPGRAGELCFVGTGEGVPTTTVSIESRDQALTLIQTSERGAPAPKEKSDKAVLRSVNIPQIKLEDTIGAHQIQGVRQFGSTDALVGAQDVVNTRMGKMSSRHDLTIEHHRLGALKGLIKDADGSSLTNLFSLFNITNDNSAVGGGATDASPKIFRYDLDSPSDGSKDIRELNMEVIRWIKRHAKLILPGGFKVHALCGDDFFDELISREDVKAVYQNTSEQINRLGKNYEFGVFEFGGIIFENYQGTDDNSTVSIAADEARVFLTGVPGLYAEYFAPADFFETANTIGLPRYAKVAPDQRFNQFVELHTQQNPLPLCLRPQTLVTLKAAG
jgi:hypothetical protein